MAVEATDFSSDPPITLDETPSARGLVGGAELRALAQRSDLRAATRCGIHVACLAMTGLIVWLALPFWFLLIPAMVLHGIVIVTTFAPMHECTHRTAFASRAANATVGWVAGVLGFYNATYYRYFHAWHHRYTQDPARDPELMFPRAANRWAYMKEISAFMFWYRRAIDYPLLALGKADNLPFVPDSARRGIAVSMSLQLLIYLAAVLTIVMGYGFALFFGSCRRSSRCRCCVPT
jgi:fatty acid desaturase